MMRVCMVVTNIIIIVNSIIGSLVTPTLEQEN